MKKLLFIALIIFAGNAIASSLPNCPSDQSERYHNCFGTASMGSDGSKYVGEWRDDKPHGQGTYTWGKESEFAGDNYSGEYKDNKRHGQGTYTYASGSKYVGEWKEELFHGQGTYTYADGAKYVGDFKDDKMHGQGSYAWANGDKYIGEFKDDKTHGLGTYTYANGTKESGYYMNDEYVPDICEGMGLKKGTDPFGQCVLKLIDKINKDY